MRSMASTKKPMSKSQIYPHLDVTGRGDLGDIGDIERVQVLLLCVKKPDK